MGVSSIRSLLPAISLLYLSSPVFSLPQQDHSSTFDYVIVGGGTAGSVVAHRLTENPQVTVAVIEAGTWPEDVVGNATQVPGLAFIFGGGAPEVEWGFQTAPQTALNDRVLPYYRAKALGGCSDINFMAYSHSSKGVFQLWADLVNDQSYTYENVLQYYDKSMNFTPPDNAERFANATPEFNVTNTVQGGPLQYTYASFAQSWSTWVAKGLQVIGMLETDAFIDGKGNGSTWQLSTINHPNGFRSSAESGFLRPIVSRPNLTILNGTLAERIIFNKSKVATGVKVSVANETHTLSAKKEVIVSAGVFQSPQLLQVSGVGPKALLEKYNIPVIANRPGVGLNMHDQTEIPISYQADLVTQSTLGDGDNMARAVAQFNANGTGPLASPGGDYVGLEKIPAEYRGNFAKETVDYTSSLPSDWPELQYLLLPAAVTGDTTTGNTVETQPGANYGSILAVLVAAQSRGNLTIKSSSMSDAPVINPNYLSTQADIDLMIAGFKRVRQALTSKAMAPILIGDEFFPGPTVQTDKQILTYLRQTANPMSHAFATCKMGNSSDPEAVVDSHGKVFGVKNLRVIDASAFPFVPPGPSPQGQVYMLAEKLADAIKKDK